MLKKKPKGLTIAIDEKNVYDSSFDEGKRIARRLYSGVVAGVSPGYYTSDDKKSLLGFIAGIRSMAADLARNSYDQTDKDIMLQVECQPSKNAENTNTIDALDRVPGEWYYYGSHDNNDEAYGGIYSLLDQRQDVINFKKEVLLKLLSSNLNVRPIGPLDIAKWTSIAEDLVKYVYGDLTGLKETYSVNVYTDKWEKANTDDLETSDNNEQK